jgi:hypothetical protein
LSGKGKQEMKILRSKVRTLWDLSPHEVWIKGRRKGRNLLGKTDRGWNYSLEAVLANPKHMNVKLEIERWERHWRVCRLHDIGHLEKEFEFAGKNVMELGCGPVLGCGPAALFHGADRFWYREPDLIRNALESPRIKKKYFVPLYEELVSNYGSKKTFDDWYSRVIELSSPLPDGAEQLVDITVSHSVLEHVLLSELSMVLSDLYRAARSESWFTHTVDFGPHGGRLSDVYVKSRHEKPAHINLLRKSEIEKRFADSGFELSASIVYKADEIGRERMHETWRTYSDEDLAARVMIFIGNRATVHDGTNL